jgi:hypothetical protein
MGARFGERFARLAETVRIGATCLAPRFLVMAAIEQ